MLFLTGVLVGALVFGRHDTTVSTTASTPGSTVTPTLTPTSTPTSTPLVPTSTTPFTLPSTSVAPDPLIDLGSGVSFTAPLGFAGTRVGDGVRITNGPVSFYSAVVARPAGEDPVVALQSYIDVSHVGYPAVAYTQTMPQPLDPAGAAPSDGTLVHYRVLGAGGDPSVSLDGVVEVRRRADGLTLLTDLTVAVDSDGVVRAAVPDGMVEELIGSFLQAPVIAASVDLVASTPTLLDSTRPAPVVDGLVTVGLPLGWSITLPGPGVVAMASPEGEQFVVTRAQDASDLSTGQQQAFAALEAILPGAVTTGFVDSNSSSSSVVVSTTTLTATASGVQQDGSMRVWVDLQRSQVFVAVSIHPSNIAPSPVVQAYLLDPLGRSIEGPR